MAVVRVALAEHSGGMTALPENSPIQPYDPQGLRESVHVDELEVVEVAPGILRRSFTTTDHARAWLIDFAPGTQWPAVDSHDKEERYYVLSGEVVEGGRRFPAGTYVTFDAGSSHRPASETGARMLGINLA